MTTDEETGIVQANVAEFEETALAADTVNSPVQGELDTSNKNTEKDKKHSENLYAITNAVIYQQSGFIEDTIPDKQKLLKSLALLKNFIPQNFYLKLKQGQDFNERIEYVHPKMISLEDAKLLFQTQFSDTYEFLLKTDFGKAYELTFESREEGIDFSKIKNIPEIRILFSHMNQTPLGTANPYLYLLTRPVRERAFLSGVIKKIDDRDKDKIYIDRNSVHASFDPVRNFYSSITLTDLVSYAKDVDEKNIAQYIRAIKELSYLNL